MASVKSRELLGNECSGERVGGKMPFLSILANNPLYPASPLKADIVLKNVCERKSGKTQNHLGDKCNSSRKLSVAGSPLNSKLSRGRKVRSSGDLPVTFKTKIKSSGYGQQTSPSKLFTPKTNSKTSSQSGKPSRRGLKNPLPHSSKSAKSAKLGIADVHGKQYPTDCGPLTRLQCKYRVCDSEVRNVGVSCVEFSHDGRFLAEASTDRTCRSVRLPPLIAPPASMGRSYSTSSEGGGVRCLYQNKIEMPLIVKSRMKPSEAMYNYLSGLQGMDYVGHDGHVEKIHWSQDGQYLISSSADHTVKIWNNNKPDTVFTIRHPISNIKSKDDVSGNVGSKLGRGSGSMGNVSFHSSSSPSSSSSSVTSLAYSSAGSVGTSSKQVRAPGQLTFAHPIKEAKFFYLDKFILVATGARLVLYKYFIDQSIQDDIKRYQRNSCYKQVCALKSDSCGITSTSRDIPLNITPHAVFQSPLTLTGNSHASTHTLTSFVGPQSITSFDCNNGLYSQLVLTAGSNKSIEIYDMNAGRVARRVIDAHTRPIHTIALQKGSVHVNHPPALYDLFLTQSHHDGIKLWDMRCNRCVRKYQGHLNKTHSVGMEFSPCARYIATGSENKCAYLYDIRQGTYLHKLEGHGDVVSDVSFHPVSPILATGCLDGNVTFYDEIH